MFTILMDTHTTVSICWLAAFLARHPEFSVVTPEVPFPAGMTVGEHGALSVPTRTGMDGFFLCAMQKAQ